MAAKPAFEMLPRIKSPIVKSNGQAHGQDQGRGQGELTAKGRILAEEIQRSFMTMIP
jgi:hypothetical protein